MRDETIALHSGFDADPATKAVPIFQTAAYQFDSAAQAGQSIVSASQLYGTTHMLLHHVMRGQFRMAR